MSLKKVVMSLDSTPESILAELEQGKGVKIDGWLLSDQIGQGVFWLTTPYGNDCCWYELTVEGCKKCLDRIEHQADAEVEF